MRFLFLFVSIYFSALFNSSAYESFTTGGHYVVSLKVKCLIDEVGWLISPKFYGELDNMHFTTDSTIANIYYVEIDSVYYVFNEINYKRKWIKDISLIAVTDSALKKICDNNIESNTAIIVSLDDMYCHRSLFLKNFLPIDTINKYQDRLERGELWALSYTLINIDEPEYLPKHYFYKKYIGEPSGKSIIPYKIFEKKLEKILKSDPYKEKNEKEILKEIMVSIYANLEVFTPENDRLCQEISLLDDTIDNIKSQSDTYKGKQIIECEKNKLK